MPNDVDVTSGGVNGWLGLDQIDWGGEAGKFYECWKINPCCGAPDVMQMLWCVVCWSCCNCCATSKMFASSVDQDCFLVPHCVMACCLPCVTSVLIRANLRKRLGVQGNIVGDFICTCCCGCCAQCQECRAVAPSEWNLLQPSWKTPGVVSPQIVLLK